MDKLNFKICTGCGACANICPHSAIKMIEDKKGFLKPEIDKNKCINCGLCEKNCPVLHYVSDNTLSPKVYAFINNDEQIRLNSSSGGAFPALARYIVNNNGVVFGAVYDKELKVCHTMAQNVEETLPMQISKYVQSDTKNTYQEAKSALQQGRNVLYSGTPCQIAGLKFFLGKDYENLLTLEIICHGVPSRKVFEMYKQECMNDFGSELVSINMRDKINGWHPEPIITLNTKASTHSSSGLEDTYMQAFLANMSINDCCVDCKFNKLPRVADITLGDFWGVDEFDTSLNDRKGTSIVLLNTAKGEKYFNKVIKKEARLVKEVPVEAAIKHNQNIISSSISHPKRNAYLKEISQGKKTLKQLNKKYLNAGKYPKPVMFIYRILPPQIKNPLRKIVKKILFKV